MIDQPDPRDSDRDACPGRIEGGPHTWGPYNESGTEECCFDCDAQRTKPDSHHPTPDRDPREVALLRWASVDAPQFLPLNTGETWRACWTAALEAAATDLHRLCLCGDQDDCSDHPCLASIKAAAAIRALK